MSACVYRMYAGDGSLLYVGCTLNIGQRTQQHHSRAPWWDDAVRMEIERFSTHREALTAERDAIVNEHPRWNTYPSRRSAKSCESQFAYLDKKMSGDLVNLLRRARVGRSLSEIAEWLSRECGETVRMSTVEDWLRRLDYEDARADRALCASCGERIATEVAS